MWKYLNLFEKILILYDNDEPGITGAEQLAYELAIQKVPNIYIAEWGDVPQGFDATDATEEEIKDTVTVMGGEDWELWINALSDAGVLAEGCKTVAYSYIGTELTWPIYWDGALGKAKMDLDRAAKALNDKLTATGGSANVAVLKSVVTQASSAIPVMPLYIAMVFKKMREEGVHEG